MKAFAEKKPILFEIILIVAAFVLALALGLPCQLVGFETDLAMSVGRILAGIVLLLVFRWCFDFSKQFKGFVVMLPALVFALWNVLNHFITKGTFNPFTLDILIMGLAPAIFEEVLFRGIFIHNLKASGKSDMAALLIPALIFGVIHLTNAVNGDILQALIQTGYAVVVGLVFGAIYIRTGDLFSLIVAHAAIDVTNRIFGGGGTSPVPLIIAFIVMLVILAAYAFWLVGKKGTSAESAESA